MLTFHHTCIGSSHLASGKPCQDASYSETTDHMSIAIVSDGHGGAIHSRSDIGAQLAILSAQATIEDHPLSDWENPVQRQEFFQEIVNRWTVLTIDHYFDNLTEQEIANLPLHPNVERYIRNITTLYGCTLMVACVHSNGWFAFQIGDGKCVTINRISRDETPKNNSTLPYTTLTSEPIPADDRCFLNMTTSLCDPDAATEFRFCSGNKASTPVAIFLGSDGIDNSWGTEEALHNFYIEVLKHCTSAEDVTRDLAESLPQLSQAGSQDDMSVAAIVDKNLLAANIAHLIRYQIMHCERDINQRTQRQEHLMSLVISLEQQAQLPENIENEHLQRDINHHSSQLEEVTIAIERLSKRLSRLQSQIHAYHLSDLARPNSPLA
jgi:serine/threonine protein phosphatase PrpC